MAIFVVVYISGFRRLSKRRWKLGFKRGNINPCGSLISAVPKMERIHCFPIWPDLNFSCVINDTFKVEEISLFRSLLYSITRFSWILILLPFFVRSLLR